MKQASFSVPLVALFAVVVPWGSAFAVCDDAACEARGKGCAFYTCQYDFKINDTRCMSTGVAPAGTPCSGYSNGSCGGQDYCNGSGSCVDVVLPAGTVCRPAASGCDVAETCDGTSSTCPLNQFAPDNTVCSDDNACTAGERCSAGTCTGGTPSIVFNPSPLTFPTTMQGAPASSKTLTLSNVGITPQQIVSLTASSTEFPVMDYGPTVLASRFGTATVTVGFTPAGIGTRSATIDVTTDIGCAFTGSVTGSGVLPELKVEPAGWDFGNLDINVVSPIERDFVVTNTGTIAQKLAAIRVPQGGPFAVTLVSGTSLPTVLEVGQTYTFNVSAQPTQLGEVSGDVTFSFVDTTVTTSIQVKVTGVCSSCGANAGTDAGTDDIPPEVAPGGCGCHSVGAAPLLGLVLGAIVMLARRRRARRCDQ